MSEMVIYQTGDNQIEVSVQIENETVWLSLNQIALLIDRHKSVISRHLKNIFKPGELNKDSVVVFFATHVKVIVFNPELLYQTKV